MPKMIRRPRDWPHSNEPKPKVPRPLADLCTAALWKESIKAGKAKELIEALKASGAGRHALARAGVYQFNVHSVAHVQLVNMDDTFEPYYMSLPKQAPWLGKLLEHFTHYENDEAMSFTGAPRLDWTTLGKAHEWISDRIAGLTEGQISDVMTDDSVDIVGWEDPSDTETLYGDLDRLYKDEEEWRDDNLLDIVAAFRDLLRRDFLEVRQLSPMEVYELRRTGGEISVDAHVVIDPAQWFQGFA